MNSFVHDYTERFLAVIMEINIYLLKCNEYGHSCPRFVCNACMLIGDYWWW